MRDEFILIVQVCRGWTCRPRALVVRRTPRVCAPWWRAVAAGLRLVLGCETIEEDDR